MREIRVPQRLQHRLRDGAAVSGDDCRRKGSGVAGQRGLNARRDCHAGLEHGSVVSGFLPQDQRNARVPHRAEPKEPRVAPEIEASGFDRAPWRGEMGRGHHRLAGFRRDAWNRRVQRQSYAAGRLGQWDIREPYAVERDAQRVGGGPVNGDNPACHRAVVAPVEHRPGHQVRPCAGQRQPQRDHRHGTDQRRNTRDAAQVPDKQQRSGSCRCRKHPYRGFKAEREIKTDAKAKEHRSEREQPATLRQKRPGDGIAQPRHTCPRCRCWLRHRQDISLMVNER